MDNGQFSPPIQAPQGTQPQVAEPTMDFPTAIRKLTEGAKIARIEWHNTDYGFLNQEGWVSIYRNGETFTHWKINDGDLKATDWIIVR